MNIANKTVLITGGANRGIGRALLDGAVRRGAKKIYAATRGALQHPYKRGDAPNARPRPTLRKSSLEGPCNFALLLQPDAIVRDAGTLLSDHGHTKWPAPPNPPVPSTETRENR